MRSASSYIHAPRPRGKAYTYPTMPETLALNGLPAIPTGTELTYDAVLADLLARRAPRKAKR